jgi:hypothetical protein
LLVGGGTAAAADFTTRSGRTLPEAVVLALTPDHVLFQHGTGQEQVPWAELPPALQQRIQSDPRWLELRRKQVEAGRLRDQLAETEAALGRLQQAFAKSVNQWLATPPTATTAAPSPAPPPPGPETGAPGAAQGSKDRPPSAPAAVEGVVEIPDLVLDYRADPAGSAAKYTKQTFAIRGTVARFELKLFQRRYSVALESGDKAVTVFGHFTYGQEWDAVYTKDKGQKLVARLKSGAERRLLQVGETAVIKGRCAGWKEGELNFTGCQIGP